MRRRRALERWGSRARVAGLSAFACGMLLAPAPAHAGGYYTGIKGARANGRAGAVTARADDLTAMASNPAGFARFNGTQIYVGNRFSYNDQQYTRMPTLDWSDTTNGVPAYVEFDAVTNGTRWQLLDPMLGVASDFGLKDWGFALGVFAPAGVAKQEFPVDGGQRYMMVGRDAQILHYNLSAAWKWRDLFGFGVTASWIFVPKLRYQMVIDANQFPRHVNPVSSELDMLATVEGKDPFTFNAILGGFYRPAPFFEIAASGQVVPSSIKTDSTLSIEPLSAEITDPVVLKRDGELADDVTLSMPLPLSARVGLRYIHLVNYKEQFDLELNVVYEGWSAVDQLEVDGDGLIGELLAQRLDVGHIAVEKQWRDTIGVRLGSDVNFVPDRLTVRAGLAYDSPAAKRAYAHVDFFSAHQFGGSVGASVFLRGLELALSYNYRYQPPLTIREGESEVFQEVPGSQCQSPHTDPQTCNEHYLGKPSAPANAGTYRAQSHFASLGVMYRF